MPRLSLAPPCFSLSSLAYFIFMLFVRLRKPPRFLFLNNHQRRGEGTLAEKNNARALPGPRSSVTAATSVLGGTWAKFKSGTESGGSEVVCDMAVCQGRMVASTGVSADRNSLLAS